jgi:nucleotidyltransferase/DNA polymerase involved in DNA repair
MDAFFASVEQRDHPEWVGKPVIVGADPKGGKGRGVVSTCSYEARKYGVHSAMPISQAFRLCPKGIYVLPDGKRYGEASRKIFQVFENYTPHIEAISCDEAFLDITGTRHLFGSPYETAVMIKKKIFEQVRLTASIGIAVNKLIAKIASDKCKPNGILEIPPEKTLEFLWPLPVERLWGVGVETAKILHGLGKNTIGDIARTPQKFWVERLGEHGRSLWQLANGIDERPVCPQEDAKSVSREHTFEEDVADPKVLRSVLSELSEDVSRKLRKEGLKGRTITLKLRFSDFKTITRAETIAERSNFFDTIFSTALRQLEACQPFRSRIRLIGVRVTNFEDNYVQESLFMDNKTEQKESIHKVIDKIKDKFGEDAIHRGV